MPLNLAVYIKLLPIYYNNTLASYFNKKNFLNPFLHKYFWPSINADIIKYISTYDLCQCIYTF